jgi:uncharacterized membrane protein YeaQ/YmgE (transglycosylase-associated protein family)
VKELDTKEEGYGDHKLDSHRGFRGVVARRIVPGPDPGRSIITIILGMAGASLGGFVFGVLGSGVTSFEVRSVPFATLGAVLLLCLYGLIARRTA